MTDPSGECSHGSVLGACVIEGCTHAPAIPPDDPWGDPDVWEVVDAPSDDMTNPVDAQFATRCRGLGCDLWIDVGDPIIRMDGQWIGADHGH